MNRIRSVKPEWLDDERLSEASPEARVLSIALLLLADDYGNGRAGLNQLAGRVFPGKPRDTLAKALNELVRLEFVHLYEVGGQHYFHVRSWAKHQRVDRPGKPLVPGPSEALAKVPEDVAKIRASRDPLPSLPGPDPDPDPGGAGGDGAQPTPDEAKPMALDWRPPPEALALFERDHRVSRKALDLATEEFIGYWTIGEGAGRRARNWTWKWRQWCLRLHKDGNLETITAEQARGRPQRALPRGDNESFDERQRKREIDRVEGVLAEVRRLNQ